MNKKITINGKEYELPKIGFKAITELEKLGVNFEDMKTFSTILGVTAYTIQGTTDKASEEIENHIANGGKIDDFIPLIKVVTDSSFFQNLAKNNK